MSAHFQLVAGHLALDFANTLDWRYDPERLIELLPTYERFLAFAEQNGLITGVQARKLLAETNERMALRVLQRVIELREALYFLFQAVAAGEPPARVHLQTLNKFLAENRVPEVILWRKAEFVRGSSDLAEKPEAPLWPILEAATDLLLSADRQHIRECSETSCRWLFLDRSKNHSRRWCDMKLCGNRNKVQRFYAKQHSENRAEEE